MPNRKVTMGAAGGAVTLILLWIVSLVWPYVTVPPEIATAFTTVVSFALSYLVPEAGSA